MRRVCGVATGMAVLLAPAMINPSAAGADQPNWPAAGGQPIDYVIQRAVSQRGVPYVYGGGDTNGPTSGVRPPTRALPGGGTLPGTPSAVGSTGFPGAGRPPAVPVSPGPGVMPRQGVTPGSVTVGFDSSGLIQYAFAGAGIKMPRTSGEQCNVGRKVPPAQARRGDLICYGPGGNQSVALYLGNGQMIEGTEPAVTISQARTTNMVPYLTRIIES